MNTKLVGNLVLAGFVLLAAGVQAQTVTLVSTLTNRPAFSLESQGMTQTRFVAPGQKIVVPEGKFSGLGNKRTALDAGSTYYLARFGATDGLYRLGTDQVLILNQSGRAVHLRLVGSVVVDGWMANGAVALGARGPSGELKAEWNEGDAVQSTDLEPGRLYRLVLDSPEGLGTVVSLSPWDSATE